MTRVYEKSVAFHLAGKYAPAHQGMPDSEGKVSLGAVQKLRRQLNAGGSSDAFT